MAVKSLRSRDPSALSDFEQEARILSGLSDPNLVRVVGACLGQGDPAAMVCQYGEAAQDMHHFLQDHVAETTGGGGGGAG